MTPGNRGLTPPRHRKTDVCVSRCLWATHSSKDCVRIRKFNVTCNSESCVAQWQMATGMASEAKTAMDKSAAAAVPAKLCSLLALDKLGVLLPSDALPSRSPAEETHSKHIETSGAQYQPSAHLSYDPTPAGAEPLTPWSSLLQWLPAVALGPGKLKLVSQIQCLPWLADIDCRFETSDAWHF